MLACWRNMAAFGALDECLYSRTAAKEPPAATFSFSSMWSATSSTVAVALGRKMCTSLPYRFSCFSLTLHDQTACKQNYAIAHQC